MALIDMALIATLREYLEQRSRQRFLDRCQDSSNPELRGRLVTVVDAIVADALATGWADIWREDGMEHITVELPFEPAGSAQRTIHPDGWRDHAIYTERRFRPDAGPWLYTSTGRDIDFGVRFRPGAGFITAEGFLDYVASAAGVAVPEGSGEPIA